MTEPPPTTAPSRGLVLLVEDDADIRGVITQILELEGYPVIAAANGEEALEQIRRNGLPSLILLDLMMPVMNGWQFRTAQLRDARLADVPVIVLSGDGNVPTKAASMQAAGFLKKPVELATLLATVDRYC